MLSLILLTSSGSKIIKNNSSAQLGSSFDHQETYKLNTEDLAHGQLNGVTTGSILSAHDCFELGRQSYNSGDAVHTVEWMNQALKRWDEEEKKTVDKVINLNVALTGTVLVAQW